MYDASTLAQWHGWWLLVTRTAAAAAAAAEEGEEEEAHLRCMPEAH